MAQSDSLPRRKPRFKERKAAKRPAPEVIPQPALPVTPVATRPRIAVRPGAVAMPAITLEQGLYIGLLVLGFALRIWDVGGRAMHGDESIHAWFAWHLYNGTGYQYDPVYHGPLQFIVTAFFYFIFGVSTTTARLMAVLFGTVLVALPYSLRSYMGRASALTAAAFIAISPAFVYVSRLERDDIFTCLFALTIAIGLFGFVRTARVRFLYLMAVSIALSLSAMENTYITIFIFVTYSATVLISEALALRPSGERLIRFWRRTGEEGTIHFRVIAGYLAVLVLALLLTIATGAGVPVPLVLALGIVALVHRQAVLDTAASGRGAHLTAFAGITRQQWLHALTLMAAILFLTFSTFGTNLQGVWDSSRPFFNTGNACPANSFPLNPCRKDIIGGLFYWLSQHQVHRGGQPWFYYTFLFGLYEQIAVIFGVGGILYFLRRPTTFSTFVTFWAILSFGVYSWAGEKFPWLMIHPLLPFTLLAAMFVTAVLRNGRAVAYGAATVLAILVVLELHSMFEVNFVNGADPVEMMVYVQSAPDTPTVASAIQTLSNKVTGGNGLTVSIDTLDTWPFAWYLRDMPHVLYPGYPALASPPYTKAPVIIVSDTYQSSLAAKLRGHYTEHKYRLRWWFPEDYKTLSWTTFAADAIKPSIWGGIKDWLLFRRPFGPKGAVWFYYYVKNGLASPY